MSGAGQSEGGRYAAVRAWLRPRQVSRWLGLFLVAFFLVPIVCLILADAVGGSAAPTISLIAFLVLIPGIVVGAALPLVWIGLMIFLSFRDHRAQAAVGDDRPAPAPTAIPRELAADIAELERVRAEVSAAARKRLVILLPLVAVVLLGIQFGTDDKLAWPPFILIFAIAMFGVWQLVTYGPNRHYAELFKTVTLPRLLARHGALSLARDHVPELGELVANGVLPGFTEVETDDHVHGPYRGRQLFITELRLRHENFKKKGVLFRGLVVEIAFERPLQQTIAVVMQGARAGGLPPVRLEDPLFEAVYSAFGSDQIAARALLTPMTMERMLRMSDGTGFQPPKLYAGGRRLVFVLDGANGGDEFESFEPPHLVGTDASRQVAALAGELDRIFALVDAIIDAVEVAPGIFSAGSGAGASLETPLRGSSESDS
ncbi:DUF3137 domain-containing protein [Bosea caraganae]|uniref:DUF3137 domain-containing protein n=1 Tax=Bosea caraganae TaxID=2763117 RepID=A0A370LBF7_9HYPH|nr:DUF3137 domain-containing protein [Bosea caraganae]RDJ21733.1 DUF3137 domain-containing protein [Bosea caraganae]RDJ28236.1 DUF3137 domain-containing protein [Bosea caraganae]